MISDQKHAEQMRLADIAWHDVRQEIARAIRLHPRQFNSRHEGWAVIHEELDELWDAVRADDTPNARKEAVQVAAMAIRFLMDIR